MQLIYYKIQCLNIHKHVDIYKMSIKYINLKDSIINIIESTTIILTINQSKKKKKKNRN